MNPDCFLNNNSHACELEIQVGDTTISQVYNKVYYNCIDGVARSKSGAATLPTDRVGRPGKSAGPESLQARKVCRPGKSDANRAAMLGSAAP